jgi:hypothetical protein
VGLLPIYSKLFCVGPFVSLKHVRRIPQDNEKKVLRIGEEKRLSKSMLKCN